MNEKNTLMSIGLLGFTLVTLKLAGLINWAWWAAIMLAVYLLNN